MCQGCVEQAWRHGTGGCNVGLRRGAEKGACSCGSNFFDMK